MSNFKESDILSRLASVTISGKLVVEGVADQDDAAVLQIPDGNELCATTDFVRGTGFTLFGMGHLTYSELGRYVVGANVSDLAAMGATPLCYLSVVRYEPSRTLDAVADILSGIDEACADYECPLVGGDTGSYHADVLSGTALGLLPQGKRLSRKSMQAGDILLVSGEIGGAGAALAAAIKGLDKELPEAFQHALGRWKFIQPRQALGRALIGVPFRVSGMDVSDGLTASLQQLRRITGLGFEINSAKLPIAESTKAISGALNVDPVHLACSASVDFELLLSCKPENLQEVLDAANLSNTNVSVIGRVTEKSDITFLRSDGSAYENAPGIPWDHQVTDIRQIYKNE